MSIEELTKQKDNAYWERNQLVAFISKLFPSFLSRHSENEKDSEDGWNWIVYTYIPTGQISFHLHDSELDNFSHLTKKQVKWDGHTTDEKYKRIAQVNLK